MNVPLQPNPTAAGDADALRDQWLIYRLRYLPTLLFLAFLLGNTRFRPLSGWMLLGRWPCLFAISGLVFLTVVATPRRLRPLPWLSGIYLLIFVWIASTIPYSSNSTVSLAKWLVYFTFLVFCALFFAQIRRREDAVWVLTPLIWLFVGFIWLIPPSVFVFPQRLFSDLGSVNGFLLFSNALGQFMVLFGLPGCLFAAAHARSQRQRWLFTATVLLAGVLVFASGARTGAFAMVLVYGLAFWRWRSWEGQWAAPAKVAILLIALLMVPGNIDRIRRFVLKYPTATGLLESRYSYWDATTRSFEDNLWAGTGFGVQEQQATSQLSFNTRGQFREQGSTYLGMLEETGLMGSVPLFVLLALIAVRHGVLLLRSRDPLVLLCSRMVLAGLLWAVSENYLLYLGNAASLLFVYGLFLGERLLQIQAAERSRQHAVAPFTPWRAQPRRPLAGTGA